MENRILAKANSLDIEFNDGRKPMGSDETLSESLPERELPLSLVICSRADNYAGNSIYRLQTSLNFLAFQLEALGRLNDVEVIVTDWGCETPLRQSMALSPSAAGMARFLEVSPRLARDQQNDSPFAEVIANNASIRRSRGTYIGRIDQDTLVGSHFLKGFFNHVDGHKDVVPGALDTSFMFTGRYHVPLGYVRTLPDLTSVVSYIDALGPLLPRDGVCQRPWFDAPVGVAMMHRDLWHDCKGYDERLIYWGFMETDLALRINQKYSLLNIGPLLGRDLFHLSHTTQRIAVTNRRKNPRVTPQSFAPNGPNWGLGQHDLELRKAVPSETSPVRSSALESGKWKLRAQHGPYVMQEYFWETALTGPRFVRSLMLGDRIHAASDSGHLHLDEDVSK